MPEPIQATTSEPMPSIETRLTRLERALREVCCELDFVERAGAPDDAMHYRCICNRREIPGDPRLFPPYTGESGIVSFPTPPHPPAAQTPAPPASEQASGFCTHMELPNGVVWSQTGWYLRLRDGHWRWVCDLTEIDTDAVRAVRAAIAGEPAPTPKAEPKPEEERVRWFRLKDDHDDYWRVDPIGEVLFNWGSGTSPSLRPTMNETLQTLLSNECLEEFFPDSPAPKDAESVGEDIVKRLDSLGRKLQIGGLNTDASALVFESAEAIDTLRSQLAAMTERAENWKREALMTRPAMDDYHPNLPGITRAQGWPLYQLVRKANDEGVKPPPLDTVAL